MKYDHLWVCQICATPWVVPSLARDCCDDGYALDSVIRVRSAS